MMSLEQQKCAKLGISQSPLLELTNRNKGFMLLLLQEYLNAHRVNFNMYKASYKTIKNKTNNMNDFED
jgi:hypothetical protein